MLYFALFIGSFVLTLFFLYLNSVLKDGKVNNVSIQKIVYLLALIFLVPINLFTLSHFIFYLVFTSYDSLVAGSYVTISSITLVVMIILVTFFYKVLRRNNDKIFASLPVLTDIKVFRILFVFICVITAFCVYHYIFTDNKFLSVYAVYYFIFLIFYFIYGTYLAYALTNDLQRRNLDQSEIFNMLNAK